MIIHNAPQGSEAWELVRKGKATASEFSRILTPAKLQFASGAGEVCQGGVPGAFGLAGR
jgi:hypothetical protein